MLELCWSLEGSGHTADRAPARRGARPHHSAFDNRLTHVKTVGMVHKLMRRDLLSAGVIELAEINHESEHGTLLPTHDASPKISYMRWGEKSPRRVFPPFGRTRHGLQVAMTAWNKVIAYYSGYEPGIKSLLLLLFGRA